MKKLVLLAILAASLTACGGEDPSAKAVSAMNRGLAELGRFEYLLASRAFREALRESPDWTDAKVNLSICLLNMRGKNHDEAQEILRGVLMEDPGNPHANFILGFLLRFNARAEEALPCFERVLAHDPTDPATLYWMAMSLGDLDRYEEALEYLNAAIEADPYLAAAYSSRFEKMRLTGRGAESADSRAISARLRAPARKQFPIHGNMLTGKAYHEIGRYAMAVRRYAPPSGEAPASSHVSPDAAALSFSRPADEALAAYRYGGGEGAEFTAEPGGTLEAVSRIGPGVVVGDYDGDGDADAFLPGWNGPGRLYRNRGDATFDEVSDAAGILTSCRGISGAFFDADGDGDQDLYVTAAGPNVFYENLGDGTFADRTETTGLAGDPDVVSLQALPGDFDHEGDIDLFVAGYCRLSDEAPAGAPDALFQNNRDGSFTDIAADKGISGGDERTVGALSLDVDRDLDTDLLVIRDRGPAALWLNERIWNFRAGALPPELTGTEPAWGAAAGDVDRDGREEILVFRGPGAGAAWFQKDEAGGLVPDPRGFASLRWRTGVLLDADLDGDLDLVGDDVVPLAGAPAIGPIGATDGAAPDDSRGIGFADFDGDGDLDRLAAGNGGAGVVLTDAPKSHHWLAFELEGREALQPAAYAARSGPDSELEIRAGGLWQPLRARTSSGFLSTVESPVRFGLGLETRADLVRIVWPDRVLQVEAEIPADQVKRIVELNRKPASCPMLFAWDGERFRFVSDFLGVGGLGFFLGPGLYGEPDGDEYVRIGGEVRPIDGDIVLQALEPLEEITYFDEATLLVVDHPEGMEVHPNERYAGERARFPEARIWGVSEKVFPAKARSLSGEDVLDRILRADRIYAPLEPDLRFPGVAKEHAVVLDFTGRVPEVGKGGRLVLYLHGWIEYGYSNTFFAASQAGVAGLAPVLEVPDGKGGFTAVMENIGCPAGLPKTMTLDVTGVVTPDRPIFRIRTNYEVYWDRIFLGKDEAPGRVTTTRIAPAKAHLHDRGYPREYSPDGRQPLIYDYGIMDPGYTFKNFTGAFTKFGDVTPLLTRTDDRYVIMGHGEELTLRFPVAGLAAPKEGMERTFILYSSGWCKDMDPYTAHPDTVGPLPFRGMSGYPYGDGESYPDTEENRRYREEWNTRKVLPRRR